MFALFRQKRTQLETAEKLYARVIEQARQPVFYSFYQVPDSIDGRFEMICLHVFLVMERLFEEGREGKKTAQALFDVMFRDMDRSLREIGIGDLSLPKHVKRMMKGFNGRATAYQQAMHSGAPDDLVAVLARNLYGTLDEMPTDKARAIALYMQESAQHLAQQPWEQIAAGDVRFKEIQDEEQAAGAKAQKRCPYSGANNDTKNDEKEDGSNNAGMVA